MGQGLGRNSPVVLSLGRENYEALIDRHGQWMRWRVAEKCPCSTGASMQPDIRCKKCGGLGVTYGFQKEADAWQVVQVTDASGIVDVGAELSGCRLVKVYDTDGNCYPDATKEDGFVFLNSEKLPAKGDYVTVVMSRETAITAVGGRCERIGAGWYRVPGLESSNQKIAGIYHTAPGDIISIGKITDANGRVYEASELRQDTFFIEPLTETVTDDDGNEEEREVPIADPVRAEGVRYIPPFCFVLLSQNLSKAEADMVRELEGDAVLTFPWCYDVAEDDVVTVLSGTITRKAVVCRKSAGYDVLPSYFAGGITLCRGRARDYTEGEDFILCGTNRIKWLAEDAPAEGEAYSVTYRIFPTYKVLKSVPQVRTSENQRMPKKAVVRLYDTYGELRKINRQ